MNHWKVSGRVALFVVAMLGWASPCQAELILGYSSAVNDVYISGTFPGNTPPTANPNGSFLLQGYDLSGIGWVPAANGSGTKLVTMISDIHFVGAQHFLPGVSTTIAFRAADGSYVTRTVASQTQIGGSDVMIGQLNAPLPTGLGGVTSYAIAVGPRASFMGQTTYMFGQHGQVGQNRIGDWLFPNGPNLTENVGTGVTSILQTDYDPNYNLDGTGGLSSEFFSTPGDSGSPDMMIVNGQLALMGTHMAAYSDGSSVPAGTAESFLSDYQSLIAANLALSGRFLQTTPVPEPGSLALMGLVASGAIWRKVRRSRGTVAA